MTDTISGGFGGQQSHLDQKDGFLLFCFFYLKVHISLRLNVEMCEIPECLSFVGCSCSDC